MKSYKISVTNTVLLPQEVMETLNVKPGDSIVFSVEKEEVTIKKGGEQT